MRSYDSLRLPQPTIDCKVWEAARATTANPPLFKQFGIDANKPTGFGASERANPIENIWDEARILWPGRKMISVSIGAGAFPRNISSGKLGASIEAVARSCFHAEATALTFELQQTETSMEPSLYRFSAPTLANIGLEEHNAMADIEAAAQSYLESIEMQDPLRRCIDDLSKFNSEGSFHIPVLNVSIKFTLSYESPMPLSNSRHSELMNSNFKSLLNSFFPSTCL